MRERRAVRVVVVGALLSFGWSCAPSVREEVLERGQPTGQYVECQPLTVPADTQRVGSSGRRLQSGRSRLDIPARAVQSERVFTFATDRGRRVRVDITPGDTLLRPTRLTIDLTHCPDSVMETDLQIWRFREEGGPGEQLRTHKNGQSVFTIIQHSSHYMIVN